MSREDFDIDKIPKRLNIYKMISRGSPTVSSNWNLMVLKLLKRLKPDCFEGVVAAVALYRPGPLDAGMVDDYIDRKHDVKMSTSPSLRTNSQYDLRCHRLSKQVMRVAVDLSGFTLRALISSVRRWVKKPMLWKLGKQFVDGAYEGGMPKSRTGRKH